MYILQSLLLIGGEWVLINLYIFKWSNIVTREGQQAFIPMLLCGFILCPPIMLYYVIVRNRERPRPKEL